MAKSAEKNYVDGDIASETFSFLFRKIKFIFPYFYLSILVAFFIKQIFQYSGHAFSDFFMSLPEFLFLQMAGFQVFCPTGVAWYLSAMFLSMLILYPLLKKNSQLFYVVWGPLLTIFLLGFMVATSSTTDHPGHLYGGVIYKGLIRGMAELSAGVLCYKLSVCLSVLKLTTLARDLITLTEVSCYGVVLFIICATTAGNIDFLAILLLCTGLVITLSGQSYLNGITNAKLSNFLAKYSIALFFNNFYWGSIIKTWFPDMERLPLLFIYVLICLLTAYFVLFIVENMISKSVAFREYLKLKFIAET